MSQIVDLASRAPSAGKTQGWHALVITAIDTAKFWDDTLAVEKRESFRWKQLLDAPIIALVFADPLAYVERYSEHDKAHTGLGASAEAWPTPYWTVDASFAAMTMLLAAEDAGLGALFFAVFSGENELRTRLCIPDALQLIGAIALGWLRAQPTVSAPIASARTVPQLEEIIQVVEVHDLTQKLKKELAVQEKD